MMKKSWRKGLKRMMALVMSAALVMPWGLRNNLLPEITAKAAQAIPSIVVDFEDSSKLNLTDGAKLISDQELNSKVLQFTASTDDTKNKIASMDNPAKGMNLSVSSGLTISYKVKSEDYGDNFFLVGLMNFGTGICAIIGKPYVCVNQNGVVLDYNNYQGTNANYFEKKVWQEFTIVFDKEKGEVRTYKNGTRLEVSTESMMGVTKENITATIDFITGADKLYFGKAGFWADSATILMDDLTFYNKALTDQEISGETETIPTVKIEDAELDSLYSKVSNIRNSVHDPSVVVVSGTTLQYYIFGSHMGVSKTSDLRNWTSVTSELETSALFGDTNGVPVSYNNAFLQNKLTGVQTLYSENGASYTVDFKTFNAVAWCTAVKATDGSAWKVQGNMWAPDVIYNKELNKWCMYLSLNGNKWNSAIILLTSDSVEGPYVYQAPVVFSGFTASKETSDTLSFKNTDMGLVTSIGESASLPARYDKISNNQWGTYWPHAIDPAVFYDEAGKLWMSYGSWSGGIYVLQLDEKTGLRDYSVNYGTDFEEKSASVTCDPYFGKKIAGGYYVSGEGSYIKHIGNYYFLFMSYGFYSPDGGYEMRVFRSENPDGPYVDTNGISAVYDKYSLNFGLASQSNRGLKLMGNYKWNTMEKGETAQGHNSAFVDENGKGYVVYHTKFDDGTAGHEVRVHQLYLNEEGWIVAAPYEYAGETISEAGYDKNEIAGDYELILHKYGVDYARLETVKPVNVTLKPDGTIAGAYTGTWQQQSGKAYVNITIEGVTYSGVFSRQIIDGTNMETMCFTAVNKDGVCIWGSKNISDQQAVAYNAKTVIVPEGTFQSLPLAASGAYGTKYSWKSENPSVLSDGGTVTVPAVDTEVPVTLTISKGNYYYEKNAIIKVYADHTNTEELKFEVGSYFENAPQELSGHMDKSLYVANPFYVETMPGIDISNGVSVEFDVEKTGTLSFLGTLLSFMGKEGSDGRLYFTPGSYLGFNKSPSCWFDANIKNYGLVQDYIGNSAHIELRFSPRGFRVYVNNVIAYDQSILETENGSGLLPDYKEVLTWLTEKADRLYFGWGSWWGTAGFDEAHNTISNVKCYVITQKGSVTDITDQEVCNIVNETITNALPMRTDQDVILPQVGDYETSIVWSAAGGILDGYTLKAGKGSELVTLRAEITYKNSRFSYEHKINMRGSEEEATTPDVSYSFNQTLSSTDGLGATTLTGSFINSTTQMQPVFVQDQTTGKQAVSFTGAGSYGIALPDALRSGAASISYHVKVSNSTANTPQVFIKGELGTNERWISIGRGWKGDGEMMVWSHDTVADRWYDSCITSLSTGEWHTIVVVFEGITATLYVDGVGISGEIPDIINETSELYLGVNAWDTPFDGVISDFSIYNRALTKEDVQRINGK